MEPNDRKHIEATELGVSTKPPLRPHTRQSLVTKLSVQRIQALLTKTHLTPAHFGRLAGVSQSWLRSLLRGEREPGEKLLERLHKALEVLESTLLEQKKPGPQEPVEQKTSWGRRRRRRVILRPEQLRALLAASFGGLVTNWILWAAETGARPRELAELRWGDLDLSARVVCLRGSKTNPTPRRLPLSEQLHAWCLMQPKAQPADRVLRTGPALARELAATGKRAGLGLVTPMTIRRSVAQGFIEATLFDKADATPTLH